MLGIGAIELERLPEVSDQRAADGDPRRAGASADRASRGATRATPEEAATLYETFGERVRRYVAFRVRSPEDAEDLTADVFRRILSGPVPIDHGARPAWLFRVAHNAIVDHYRRRRFTIPLFGLLERPDDAPSLPDRAIRDEELQTVDRALAGLVGRQRAAIYLRYYEDLEYADVAHVMGVPAVTARSLVHRGLKKVAAQLGRARAPRRERPVSSDGRLPNQPDPVDPLALAEAVAAGRLGFPAAEAALWEARPERSCPGGRRRGRAARSRRRHPRRPPARRGHPSGGGRGVRPGRDKRARRAGSSGR